MFIFPRVFMLAATLCAFVITFVRNVSALVAGTGAMSKEGLQIFFIVLLVILAINLTLEGAKTLRTKKPAEESKVA